MTTQFSPQLHGQYKAKAYAAANAKSPLVPFTIPRRNSGEHDVQIEIFSVAFATLISTKSVTNGAARHEHYYCVGIILLLFSIVLSYAYHCIPITT